MRPITRHSELRAALHAISKDAQALKEVLDYILEEANRAGSSGPVERHTQQFDWYLDQIGDARAKRLYNALTTNIPDMANRLTALRAAWATITTGPPETIRPEPEGPPAVTKKELQTLKRAQNRRAGRDEECVVIEVER